MSTALYLKIASGLTATVYGFGEMKCGDYNAIPQPCSPEAVTASGEQFTPYLPTGALAAPQFLLLKSQIVYLRIEHGRCVPIRINDKMHEKWIGRRGFDLTPQAVFALTGRVPEKTWSGRVFVCPAAHSSNPNREFQ